MMTGSAIGVTGGQERRCEISVESGFRAGELGVMRCEGSLQHVDSVGVAEAGQRVTAPADEMTGRECDVWLPEVRLGMLREKLRSVVECTQTRIPMTVSGEGFAMCGGEP